jgi:ATP-binding cassette, subfamily B, bacterial MsbA
MVYLRDVKAQIAVGLFFMVLSSLLAGANIGLIYPFFEGVFLRPAGAGVVPDSGGTFFSMIAELGDVFSQAFHSELGLRSALSTGFDGFLHLHSQGEILLFLCGAAILAATAKFIALYFYRFCFVHVEQTLIRELRNHLFKHLQSLSIDTVQSFRQGEFISRLINDVMVVRSLTITKVTALGMNFMQAMVYFSIALYIDWRMTLLSILVLTPAVMSFQVIGQRLRRYSRRAQEHISRVTNRLSENLSGFRVVQVFGAALREQSRFETSTASYFKRVRKLEWVSSFSSPFAEWASILVAVFMLWYGGTRILSTDAHLSGPSFLTFLTALLAMLHPLKVVARTWNDLQKGTGAGDRILEVFALKSSLKLAPNPKIIDTFDEDITLNSVHFSHGETGVLQDINLSLKKGEFLALVGGSGSGKTTLANLILRLIDPNEGSVTCDGSNIKDLDLLAYRRLFGVVGQDTWLFNLNVAENVCYPQSCQDSATVQAALQTANATDFVEEMGGIHSEILEGGSNLSGGQRQRLAIARAVSRQPHILVFDEATSALDTESEMLVQEALRSSIGHRTALVIAHRLSTVIRADRIVCLQSGRIVGVGPHLDLLESCPEYKKLYELQFQV